MFKYLITLLIAINSVSFAAELHAIVVCDTHAIDLEEGVEHDYKHIKKELKAIAKATGLNLSMQTFTGHCVNSQFFNTVKKLKANPDDVIVFYWSGHGTRFLDQEDPWPYFDFEYDDDLQSLLDVTHELMKKKARLVLSIADCCNDFHEIVPDHYPMKAKALKPSKNSESGYRKLFLEARGVYIATAALPGEASIALDEEDEEIGVPGGSFFTNAILETVHSEVNKPNDLSWDRIFSIAVAKAIEYQLKDSEDPVVYHHPQFKCLTP
jgi:hypothetical protein